MDLKIINNNYPLLKARFIRSKMLLNFEDALNLEMSNGDIDQIYMCWQGCDLVSVVLVFDINAHINLSLHVWFWQCWRGGDELPKAIWRTKLFRLVFVKLLLVFDINAHHVWLWQCWRGGDELPKAIWFLWLVSASWPTTIQICHQAIIIMIMIFAIINGSSVMNSGKKLQDDFPKMRGGGESKAVLSGNLQMKHKISGQRLIF